MRRLGRNWKRLHRCVYAAGVLAVLHFLWQAKATERWEPLLYALALALLLFVRIPAVRQPIVALRRRLTGDAKLRPAVTKATKPPRQVSTSAD
jgi:sulfoxide reductase heme-binding subunit YedZ